MAAGLAQAPLPWLPEGATEIGRGVGLVADDDGSGQVWVHGMMTFCWAGGDEASRRLAAVQLAELKAATQKQVAAGFGATPMTVWRWADAYRRDGVAGLIPAPRGPKGPSKVTAELAGRIRELAGDGSLSQQQVAQRCGVSEFTVRAVLGKVAARREAAARLAAGGAAAGNAAGDAAPGWAQEELPGQEPPVLPDPVPRGAERALARFGLLGEGAAPVFTAAAKVPYAGLLLALPALARTGLLDAARAVYGGLRNGFYGLETVLVLLVFLALLREPRAEGATRVPPAALGRVLGLDRAPEVKTIRRKLGELAAAGKAADLQLAIARHHAATRPDDLGFLYIDGHTRAYFGTREVQKTHVARLKFPSPATEETWVTGQSGDPLLIVIGEPSDSLAARIKDLLPGLRGICGEHARPVLCFDRGGWSLDLFAEVIKAGFGLLTYRKNAAGKPVPDLPGEKFAAVSWTGDDGRERGYDVAESRVTLTVPSGEHKGEELDLRQVTRRDKGTQVHILTTAGTGELPAGGVVYRMTGRWREENWFRYGRAHFALDSLDSYAVIPDTPGRKVPNPAKKTASAAVQAARKNLADAEAARQGKLGELKNPAPGQQITITNAMLARLDAPVETARRKLAEAQAAAKKVPAKIPLAEHNPAMVRLETETKLITHAVKMAAFNAETALARALHGRYARAGDEAYALIREALHASGDIIPGDGTLTIRLSPLGAPRRTRAIAALCGWLNDAAACYPGTSLVLHFEVKDHPGTT
ncbi:MAG TPA: helix-turn-helix domain-containing protein [Streptosporangiaceae bacterium]|nr:helix-turn-helix domain-containing protein [Streptosporangiaceae bacterium]